MQNSGFDKFIVGERLKILREREDITQGQLAQLLKITQQTYSRYETAKATLPLLHLYTLSQYYKVSDLSSTLRWEILSVLFRPSRKSRSGTSSIM